MHAVHISQSGGHLPFPYINSSEQARANAVATNREPNLLEAIASTCPPDDNSQ